jgi:hypothetical protein
MSSHRWMAYVWAAPTTAVGLACLALSAARPRVHHGVVEGVGAGVGWWFDMVAPGREFAAVALGHVVLSRSAELLDEVRAHELVHVRQAERWGPLFLPAYVWASFVAWIAGDRPYEDNWFEREARALAPDVRSTPAAVVVHSD